MQWHRAIPILGALSIGVLVSFPQLLHILDARFQGIPVHLNTDEAAYLTHVREALYGRVGQAGKGVAMDFVDEPSLAIAPIEELYGLIQRWTGLSSAWVLQIMELVEPSLLVLVLFQAFLACSIPRRRALAASVLFSLLELYNLGRPVNQRASFLFLLLTIIGMARGMQGFLLWQWLGGLLLGFLVGVYLWSWTAAWALWIVWLAFLLSSSSSAGTGRWPFLRRHLLLGAVGALVASPFFLRIFFIRSHPGYADAVARSGLTFWRLPESWPWSVLFLGMAAAATLLWWRRGRHSEELLVPALAVSAFLVLNQHVFHGMLIMFRSHYLLFLVFTATAVFFHLLPSVRASRLALVGAACAALILAAALYENRYVLKQFTVTAGRFGEQHLAGSLSALGSLPVSTVLSDPETSSFLTSHTPHYAVYNAYLQASLVTHAELAERYCLASLPFPGDPKEWDAPRITNYQVHRDPDLRERTRALEERLVQDACERVAEDPRVFLIRYGVRYVLWDEQRQPQWDPQRLGASLEPLATGEGWSLWRVPGGST